ncbi:MAG: hypothetical protein EBZ91_12705 [Gammaproteobacteria bacterium]|nr:hypothetical protein [Gammaproteobacteria bacterium]
MARQPLLASLYQDPRAGRLATVCTDGEGVVEIRRSDRYMQQLQQLQQLVVGLDCPCTYADVCTPYGFCMICHWSE